MTPARRALLYGGVAAGFAALGGWFAWQRYAPQPVSESAARLLYGQTLPDAAGQPYELGSLRGKTVVLNFWATWCPPCVEEMPELAGLHREISARNALVLGIGIDSASNIKAFAEKGEYPYPLLVAGLGGTELARQLGNQSGALPYTVVIDPDGRVIEKKLGRIKLEHLRATVLATLAQAGS
jgi:peroxiredoxin